MSNPAQWPVQGTVYGTLLNERRALEALGEQVNAAPYKEPPKAPILYIKPRNTIVANQATVVIPLDTEVVEIGATLGVVIGTTATKVPVHEAMDYVAGYTIVNDISVPHSSFYRPSMRFKCRDGFCPIGPQVVPREAVADPDALGVVVEIDGVVVQRASTSGRIRSIKQLIADVSDFMTLHPGDVLSIGVAAGSPLARAGQRVAISIEGIGVLENHLIPEKAE